MAVSGRRHDRDRWPRQRLPSTSPLSGRGASAKAAALPLALAPVLLVLLVLLVLVALVLLVLVLLLVLLLLPLPLVVTLLLLLGGALDSSSAIHQSSGTSACRMGPSPRSRAVQWGRTHRPPAVAAAPPRLVRCVA